MTHDKHTKETSRHLLYDGCWIMFYRRIGKEWCECVYNGEKVFVLEKEKAVKLGSILKHGFEDL